MPITKTLTVAQLLVLNTAADRPDQMVLPLPAQIRARGAAMSKLLASLLKEELAQEMPTKVEALSWRTDKAGQRQALRITATGRAAIGREPVAATVVAAPSAPVVIESLGSPDDVGATMQSADDGAVTAAEYKTTEPVPASGAPVAEPAAIPAVGATENPDRPGGKLGQVLAAAVGEAGATLEELVALTGWQKHTTRAAMTRLRQRGFDLRLVKVGDRKAYRPWSGA